MTERLRPDVPEADGLEQAMEVDAGESVQLPHLRDDVPEADAIEQAIEVRDDEMR